MSIAAKAPIQPKCAIASSGDSDRVGTPSPAPITSAIARIAIPSSATACQRAPGA